ncbi:MAG: PHP domain-containing protein [Actinomycetota bacterium]
MLRNIEFAELLAREVGEHEGNKQKACRRASRAALGWPDELADFVAREGKLTDLPAVGPWVGRLISTWLEEEPEVELGDDALRRDFLTLAEAKAEIATDPSWRDALQGDLQMHTVSSDGSLPVQAMAMHCVELDYSYIAVTDHSKGLRIAGGMDEAELARQGREIDEVNRVFESSGHDFRVLRSIEMNISPNGEGDMEPDALGELDLVLGSFHSQLRKKEDQTDRYLAAIRNPHVHVLGHPRGRQWNFRLGLWCDWERLFAEAAALDKAVEIDSHPNRQDLNVELLELTREAGVRISIGTDAHYQPELLFIDIGVAAAMRAGIPKDRIINFLPVEELLEWTGELKARV